MGSIPPTATSLSGWTITGVIADGQGLVSSWGGITDRFAFVSVNDGYSPAECDAVREALRMQTEDATAGSGSPLRSVSPSSTSDICAPSCNLLGFITPTTPSLSGRTTTVDISSGGIADWVVHVAVDEGYSPAECDAVRAVLLMQTEDATAGSGSPLRSFSPSSTLDKCATSCYGIHNSDNNKS